MRRLVWTVALALLVPSIGAGAILLPGPVPEQLVEGHTVWAIITTVPNATRDEEFASAVAVLVRDRTQNIINSRFPGVLWFNDQYLVDPDQTVQKKRIQPRYPCTGAVIGVNRGDPVDMDAAGRWTLINATYQNESYLITDPNDHTWNIDLWLTTNQTYAWTVAILGNDARANTPDDGKCRGGRFTDDQRRWIGVQNPGEHGMGYPCQGCSTISYNALLYFRLTHLTDDNVTKDHRERLGADWYRDAAACHESTTNEWNCPSNDDTREGNSHPFNPDLIYPLNMYDGQGNHGGSGACPDGSRMDCHATHDIDVYFGYVKPPTLRKYYLVDVVGSEAPYHCHEDHACNLDDHLN